MGRKKCEGVSGALVNVSHRESVAVCSVRRARVPSWHSESASTAYLCVISRIGVESAEIKPRDLSRDENPRAMKDSECEKSNSTNGFFLTMFFSFHCSR